MKKLTLIYTFLFVGFSAFYFLPACKKDEHPTLPPSPPEQAPVMSSIAPMQDTVGARVVITGTGFSKIASENVVKFGTGTAEVVSATKTQLVVTVPTEAQDAPVSVAVKGYLLISKDNFIVKILNPPLISGFSPSFIGVGYPVTITGTNFSGDATKNKVTVNGVAAQLVSSSTGKLVVTVPKTAITGKISVTVVNQSVNTATNINIKTLAVTTFVGGGYGQFGDGTGANAFFASPWAIIGDGTGNYYVADAGNNRIRKVTSSGVVTTIAGNGVSGSQNGAAATASFGHPMGLAFDSQGNLFVTCTAQHNIRKITPAGVVSTFAGDLNGSKGYTDATGSDARFDDPEGIAIDKNDNVFVMDATRIRKISPAGEVTTFAGSDNFGSVDGTGVAATFSRLVSVCIDADDNLYVTDVNTSNIRKVTPAAVVTTLAGTGEQGSADGTVLSATFNLPMGIIRDNTGNLYVSDMGSRTIRMITTNGEVITLAGNANLEGKDGYGGFASFGGPAGLAIDASGVIYVVDNGFSSVRKMVFQ